MALGTRTVLMAVQAMLLTAMAAWAASAHEATAYVDGETLVTFKESASLDTVQKTVGNRSLTLAKHFAWISERRHRHCALIRSKNKTTLELIAELGQDPSVEVAEPNYLRWTSAAPPNDPLFANLWGLNNSGQSINGSSGTARADIGFLAAWALARPPDTTTVVAVIDTGVDYTHPDLAPNMWTNSGEIPANQRDDDGNGYADDVHGYDFVDNLSDPTDSGYHGTHVAGTIAAAGNNGVGIVGVAYQARIMALRVSTDGSTIDSAAEIEAIQYAAMMKGRGVNVVAINASFGGGGYSDTERAAIQAAGNAGIVFCAAAGNSAGNNDVTPTYPASYRLSNMLVVAATDQNDSLASFSNYGRTTVDLAAPGVNILSAEPTSLLVTGRVQWAGTTHSATALTYSGTTTGITAAVYDCGLGYATSFPVKVSGNIALIARGTLTFSDKVAHAMAAGARGAVIYNNVDGSFLGTLQYASNWIPAVAVSQADGQALRAALPTTGTVFNSYDPSRVYQYLDGTSMASPHVVGAVAFAAMNFPNESVSARIQRVLANVDGVSALQGLVATGGRLNLRRIVDTDGNGLPDWWELAHFGRASGVDPNADPDRDGASNWMEWMAGTDPADANSALRLTDVAPSETMGLAVRWQSVAGKYYRLERMTNLTASVPNTIGTNLPATPPFNTETDTTAGSESPRYYRVRLEP